MKNQFYQWKNLKFLPYPNTHISENHLEYVLILTLLNLTSDVKKLVSNKQHKLINYKFSSVLNAAFL